MAALADRLLYGSSWSPLCRRLLAYAQLMRINRPIGIGLLLWPTLWALWIAALGVPGQHGMPALKFRDMGLVSLMPTKKGFSVYPYGNDPVTAILAKYPGHEHTKGSIHFTAAAPLPLDLYDDLIRFRLDYIQQKKS